MAPSMGGGAAPKRWPSGTRLKVERWLETQQALFAERRLSRAQLHYLAMLGGHSQGRRGGNGLGSDWSVEFGLKLCDWI